MGDIFPKIQQLLASAIQTRSLLHTIFMNAELIAVIFMYFFSLVMVAHRAFGIEMRAVTCLLTSKCLGSGSIHVQSL
jgi:hypothetical protein